MRRRWTILTALAFLVAIAGTASAQKLTSEAGNWLSPADAGSGGYNAPVKAGEFTLNFRAQVETDFENRVNYDFNRRIRDLGNKNGDFIEQETRLGMDATRGPFKMHILLEQENLWDDGADPGEAESNKENSSFHLERAWGEYDFGPFKLRVGLQNFSVDPIGIVYSDWDWGARLYQDYGDWSWSIFWFRKVEGDAAAIGVTDSGVNDNEDFDAYNFQINKAWNNPFGEGTLETGLFFVINDVQTVDLARERRGIVKSGDATSLYYVGASAQGNLGPFVVTGVYSHLFGKDATGFCRAKGQSSSPTVTPGTAGTGEECNISAHTAYLGIDYPIPGLPLIAGLEFIAVSGDGDPNDRTAHAYDVATLFDNEIFGGEYIFADDQIPLLGKADDEIMPTGLSNVVTRRAVNASPSRTVPIVSGNIADVSTARASTRSSTGLSDVNVCTSGDQIVRGTSFCKAVRSTSENGDLNFSHPGVWGINLHGIYEVTKELSVRLDGSYWRFFEADDGNLRGFTGELKRNLDTGTSGTPLSRFNENDNVGNTIGWEIGAKAVYKPHPNFSITPAFSVLIPGDGLEDLAGNGNLAWNVVVETMFTF